ncbi:MAG TPA: FtsX-like permease family protein, partial [Tepidisphaeraceae bacterium]|nr:FtsX-like permease family protein [Tepidisphaeraceae bacterium]
MRPLLTLTLANIRHRKLRFALCVLAMSLAVSLVVSITSGYASMERGLRAFVEQFVGSTDFEIQRRGDRMPSIDPSVADEVKTDPRVSSVHSRIEARITPLDEKGEPIQPAVLNLFGIQPDVDPIVHTSTMKFGRWIRAGETNAIVLDENAAASFPIEVGKKIRLPQGENFIELRVVGITKQIGFLKAFYRTGYVSIDVAQKLVLPNEPPKVTKVRGEFVANVDGDAFVKDWEAKLTKADDTLSLKLIRDQRKDLDRNLKGMRLVSLLGGTVSMLAAAFIVFGTLSMGVTERRRQLAMLRAVGATKLLVGGTVVVEALLISFIGLFVGIALGILFVQSLDWIFGDLFGAGVAIDFIGLAFAFVATTLSSLGASILPAWHASRAKPLEAMQSVASANVSRVPWKAIGIGLVLASLDSIVVLGPWDRIEATASFHREIRLYGHFAIGIGGMMLGCFLFAPLLVLFVERVIGPLAARIFGVRFELLRQQLSGSIWRSAGTGAALMVGLAVLIVMNVQSRSALSGWELPTKFPDIFILADGGFGRFDDESIARIEQTKGIRADRVMPIYVTSPRLGDNPLAIAGALKLPEATLFIGVDPKK